MLKSAEKQFSHDCVEVAMFSMERVEHRQSFCTAIVPPLKQTISMAQLPLQLALSYQDANLSHQNQNQFSGVYI